MFYIQYTNAKEKLREASEKKKDTCKQNERIQKALTILLDNTIKKKKKCTKVIE